MNRYLQLMRKYKAEMNDSNIVAIYQLMVDIYKFPKFLHPGLLMALA